MTYQSKHQFGTRIGWGRTFIVWEDVDCEVTSSAGLNDILNVVRLPSQFSSTICIKRKSGNTDGLTVNVSRYMIDATTNTNLVKREIGGPSVAFSSNLEFDAKPAGGVDRGDESLFLHAFTHVRANIAVASTGVCMADIILILSPGNASFIPGVL